MTPFLIIIAVCVIVVGILISKFNALSKNKNQIENSISSLDAIFIKRADLIPNLVTLVKKYMTFEEGALEKITAMRTVNSKSSTQLEKEGNDAMKSLMVQVENYPDLKASSQFSNLQYSWNEIEEQISAGRRYVSSSITVYNNSITTFPSNIVSNLFGFKQYDWQYATEEKRQSLDTEALFKDM